jgi:poly(3-hydroxyalkanoate) synthetase
MPTARYEQGAAEVASLRMGSAEHPPIADAPGAYVHER